tara:strand:+ start:26971 stop:27387 length:417 start_codon:yes stop_codon:yes gene_type:complete
MNSLAARAVLFALAADSPSQNGGTKYCGQRFGVAANVTLYEAPPYGGYAHVSLDGVAFSGTVSGMAWFSEAATDPQHPVKQIVKQIVMERRLQTALGRRGVSIRRIDAAEDGNTIDVSVNIPFFGERIITMHRVVPGH